MTGAARVSPREARINIDSGKPLLVCAYESDEKFQSMHLRGAISLNEFKSRLPRLSKDQEIIFYCA